MRHFISVQSSVYRARTVRIHTVNTSSPRPIHPATAAVSVFSRVNTGQNSGADVIGSA